MNEELNKVENPVEELENRIMTLPETNPNTTVTVLPPEEDSHSIVPIILGAAGTVTAGIVGTIVWLKRKKNKADRIQKLEAELAVLKEELGILDEAEQYPPEDTESSDKTE